MSDTTTRVAAVEARPRTRQPAAFAVGIATLSRKNPGRVLDAYFPVVNVHEATDIGAKIADAVGHQAGSGSVYPTREQLDAALAAVAEVGGDEQSQPNILALQGAREAAQTDAGALREYVERRAVVTFLADLAEKPVDAHDVYLRLHALSSRKVQPHGVNLEGIFGLLNNVVWTNHGPLDPDGFEWVRLRLRARGVHVEVRSVDKFPRMTDYVIPSGVRIGDADRVRLGAHLAEGTTVMHEGFVNFNAGTLGTSMVEGRISAGVVVGNGSDVGGSASIMGTLSGGGKEVIRIGESCLLGANAGVGISLGNNCTVEAGLYVTAGSRVRLPDGRVVKALELSGQDDLLFRRNSENGAIEVLAKRNQVVLNEALHQNV